MVELRIPASCIVCNFLATSYLAIYGNLCGCCFFGWTSPVLIFQLYKISFHHIHPSPNSSYKTAPSHTLVGKGYL